MRCGEHADAVTTSGTKYPVAWNAFFCAEDKSGPSPKLDSCLAKEIYRQTKS